MKNSGAFLLLSPTTTELLPLILFEDFFRILVVLIVAFAAVCRFMFACRGCSVVVLSLFIYFIITNPPDGLPLDFFYFFFADIGSQRTLLLTFLK